MAQVREAVELLEEVPELSADEVRTLLAREAALVERLAIELKAGVLQPGELPPLLENLGARLSILADPTSPWKGIGKRRG